MDFKKDLKADVKVKEESIDVGNRCLYLETFANCFARTSSATSKLELGRLASQDRRPMESTCTTRLRRR